VLVSVIHVAGVAVESDTGMLQRCAVCGEMLIDRRNEDMPDGSSGPRSFEPYAWVERNGPGLSIVTEDYVDQHVDQCCDPDATKKSFRFILGIADSAIDSHVRVSLSNSRAIQVLLAGLKKIREYSEPKGK
jgi:hypothetical protein